MTNEDKKKLEDAVAAAVTQAVRNILADQEIMSSFWSSAFVQLQQHATVSTGRWLLGSFGALLSRVSMLAAVAMLVYALGGWAALTKMAAAMGGPK